MLSLSMSILSKSSDLGQMKSLGADAISSDLGISLNKAVFLFASMALAMLFDPRRLEFP